MVVFVAIVVALAAGHRPPDPDRGLVAGAPARGDRAPGGCQRSAQSARIATTTTAFMIGIALMSLFTVVLATAREQADREIAENFPFDFVLDGVS